MSTWATRWRRRTFRDWIVLGEAGVLLVAARAMLRLAPMTMIVRWIRRPMAGRLALADAGTLERCRWAVTSFSRKAPLRLVCFPQALALYAMLRRRRIPSEVLYGVSRLNGELAAHAWLRQDGVVLVGGETAGGFSVLDTWGPGSTSGLGRQ